LIPHRSGFDKDSSEQPNCVSAPSQSNKHRLIQNKHRLAAAVVADATPRTPTPTRRNSFSVIANNDSINLNTNNSSVKILEGVSQTPNISTKRLGSFIHNGQQNVRFEILFHIVLLSVSSPRMVTPSNKHVLPSQIPTLPPTTGPPIIFLNCVVHGAEDFYLGDLCCSVCEMENQTH
jgi:hypothetical protein